MRFARRALVVFFALAILVGRPLMAADELPRLQLAWDKDYLTVSRADVPGQSVRIHYLEAYCRPGSTDRDWHETVIGHTTRLVSAAPHEIVLECTLRDGVVVNHKITAGPDEVAFSLVANNPTKTASAAHWAQPCIRVDRFTGRTQNDYLPLSFVLVSGKVTRMPTEPWATKALYTPGQVYCPKNVPRDDVNPRPLSSIVPSHGLIGCFSSDAKWILASAWEPYQELFQGVAVCLHSDFRIGGLKPGETKQIRGKLYITRQSIEELVKRYERDFPEQVPKP